MIFFKNNLKRAGLIFNIILAFSYDLGAVGDPQPDTMTRPKLNVTKSHSAEALPEATCTNLFRLIDTETRKFFDLFGTQHNIPYKVLPSAIQELIQEHTFCCMEVCNHRKLDSSKEKEEEFFNLCRQKRETFLEKFQSNKENWLQTENNTTNYLEWVPGSEEFIKLGFEVLFPDLPQIFPDLPQKRLKLESFNAQGFCALMGPCMEAGMNQRDIMDKKAMFAGKLTSGMLKFLGEQNPQWLRSEDDKTDYLDKLTENQCKNLASVFEKGLMGLEKYNTRGLWYLYLSALEITKGMDNTIESFMMRAQSLDGDGKCRAIRGDDVKIKINFKINADGKIEDDKIDNYLSKELEQESRYPAPKSTNAEDAIRELGDKLEQEWPDGTYDYLKTDYTELSEEEQEKILGLNEPIVKERNDLWMPKIVDAFKQIQTETEKDMLVVCGLAHLYGKKTGLLWKLHEEWGFNILRATPTGEFIPYLIHEKPSTIVEGTKAEETKNSA